jgi:hypothetical protein
MQLAALAAMVVVVALIRVKESAARKNVRRISFCPSAILGWLSR